MLQNFSRSIMFDVIVMFEHKIDSDLLILNERC